MLDRLFSNRTLDPDDLDLSTIADYQLQLLDDTLNSLSVEEIIDQLEKTIAELPETPPDEQVWATMLAGQLTVGGKKGIDALWRFVEQADTTALPLLLLPLVMSSQEKTKLRRFLFGLLDDDDPERVVAGISGFVLRQDRKALNRILPLRNHPSPIVRAEVLTYYRNVAPTDSLPWLLEAKEDPAPEVRRAAASCVLYLSCAPVLGEVRETFGGLRGRKLRDAAREYLDGSIFEPDELAMAVQEAFESQAFSDHEIRWRDIEDEERKDLAGEGIASFESYVMLAIQDRDDPRLLNRLHEFWQSDDPWKRYIATITMTVAGDHTFKDEILAAREADDEFVPQAAHIYHRIIDPAGAITELLELVRNGQWIDQMFAIVTIGGIFATEVDEPLRAWCQEMTEDPDEAVRKFAHLALTPEWERRFTEIEVPVIGPHWSYEPAQ